MEVENEEEVAKEEVATPKLIRCTLCLKDTEPHGLDLPFPIPDFCRNCIKYDGPYGTGLISFSKAKNTYLLTDNDIKDIAAKLASQAQLQIPKYGKMPLKIPLRSVQEVVSSKFGSIEKLIRKHITMSESEKKSAPPSVSIFAYFANKLGEN